MSPALLRTSALAGILIASAVLAPLRAQTGSVDPTAAQIAATPRWSPPKIELIEEPRIDLRPWLPPVGEQRMNDCTTWAIAYAAKSYLEARDQGWRPDGPERVFSPRFLYNQINGGQDEGSSFVEAVRVLCAQGAATMLTEPYRPGDFLAQPSERARAEARAFPLRAAHLVADRQGIRRALQRRQIVVFGAHVNPIFLSGRFDRYDRATFGRDERLRQPGQPHGKHAMCIVGYDDSEQSFLVMNSWGTRWARGGFAWVHYELFDEIRLAGEAEGVFCNWAITLLDVEERVERRADGSVTPAAATLDELAIRGYADAVRFDAEQQKFAYTFFADLRGPRTLLQTVRAVEWSWLDERGKPRRVVADDAGNGFALVAGSLQNPTPLRAVLQLQEGATHTLEGRIEGPVPVADFRPAQLRFRDQYSGRLADGTTPVWFWEAQLDVPANDVFEVVAVHWKHAAMTPGAPASAHVEGAPTPPGYATTLGWSKAAGPIECEISYRDGGRKRLQLTPQFTDVVRDEPVVECESRVMSKDASGRPVHAFSVTLDLPEGKVRDVDHVEWELDPWLAEPRRRETQRHFAWAVRGTTVRDFRAKATIVWNDGRRSEVERWLEFGPETRYPGPQRLDVEAVDTFVGVVDGAPSWQVAWRLLGDRQDLAKVTAVSWRTTAADGVVVETQGGAAAQRFPAWSRTGGRVRGVASITCGGETVERALDFVPAAPPSTAPRLELEAFVPNAALGEADVDRDRAGPRLRVRLSGPGAATTNVIAVDWVTVLEGRLERSRLVADHRFWPASLELDTSAGVPFQLGASVTFADGFVEHLEGPVVPGQSASVVLPLSLRVREKFAGFDSVLQRPTWLVTLELAGLVPLLQQQDRVQYRLVENGTGRVVATVDAAAGELVQVLCARPATVSAVVTAKDGSRSTVHGRVRAEAPPTPPLFARALRTAGGGEANSFTLWLDGYEAELAQVRLVTWRSSAHTIRQSVRAAGAYTGFAVGWPLAGGFPVVAEVELANGERRSLTVDDALWQAPVRLGATTRYHGQGLHEVECELIGPLQQLLAIAPHAVFTLQEDGREVQSERELLLRPRHLARFRVAAGKVQLRASYAIAGRVVETPPLELVVGGGEAPDELRLVGSREHTLRAPGATTADWLVRIDGPEALRQQIVRVTYDARDSYRCTVVRRFAEQQDGFAWRFADDQLTLQARVELRDRSVRELSFEAR